MPKVIDANEDAEDIRLELQAVLLPAFRQLVHLVAADAPVEELELQLGQLAEQVRASQHRVAFAQRVNVVGRRRFFVAPVIRDGVALEQNNITTLHAHGIRIPVSGSYECWYRAKQACPDEALSNKLPSVYFHLNG